LESIYQGFCRHKISTALPTSSFMMHLQNMIGSKIFMEVKNERCAR